MNRGHLWRPATVAGLAAVITTIAAVSLTSESGSTDPVLPTPPAASTGVAAPVESEVPEPEPPRPDAGSPVSPEPRPEIGRVRATPPPVQELDPPHRVTFSAVGIDAEVVPVGVEPDGQMELPENPDVLGWYSYGAVPGRGEGSVVLAGHVDSIDYGLGQLAGLSQAAPGDEIVVETPDAGSVRYIVIRVESVPQSQLPLAEVFRRAGEERLVMITCGGEYERRDGGYSDNVVVTAVRA